MSRILFKLRGVPEDEIKEVIALLDENRVDYYETDAGNWGISMPALWLKDENDYPKARELLDNYQTCLLYTSPSPRDATLSRMPSSA